MTGPKDPSTPEGEDWSFPEVDPASPTSIAMPEPEKISYDTGSDAWWRAQAQAQREAAHSEVPVPPAPVPSPLDRDWVPAELVAAAEPSPVPAPTPPPPVTPPARVTQEQALTAAALEEQSASRAPHDGAPVGPARAVAGAAIALVGVLLGVGALYLFNRPDDRGSPVVASAPRVTATSTGEPTAQPTASSSPVASAQPTAVPPIVAPTASPAAGIVPVSVLNNSKIKGLADRGSARFRAGGWPVKLTGNYRGGTIAKPTVYYAPGGLASAQRFAKQFGIPRVAPRFSGLPTTGMTVILTRDYR